MPFIIRNSIGARAISSKVDKEERLKRKRPAVSIPLTIVDDEYITPIHGRCGYRVPITQKAAGRMIKIESRAYKESNSFCPIDSLQPRNKIKDPVTINGIGQYLYYFITKGQPSIDRKDREEYDRKFG